jgi:hypothetical protein
MAAPLRKTSTVQPSLTLVMARPIQSLVSQLIEGASLGLAIAIAFQVAAWAIGRGF